MSLWQFSTIIPECHSLAVCAGRADCKNIAPLGFRQFHILTEHIGRLTYRTYDVVLLTRFLRGKILNLVISTIHCRTHKVDHSRIYYGK